MKAWIAGLLALVLATAAHAEGIGPKPSVSATGGITIGQPVTGGTPSTNLYVDSSGNIANSTNFPFGISITPAVNTTPLTISSYSLTGTDTHNLLNLAGTWNVGTTVETAILLNMTDTASGAASNLLDLQVAAVSQFKVTKGGSGTFANQLTAGGSITTTLGSLIINNTTGGLSFNADAFLLRDAANTLAQRNGVNAQTSRIYNTFTDASNYERANIGWNANVFSITTGAAGTGTSRNISITNAVGFGVNIGGANQFIGSITFASDNTFDIGASGATRPRTEYIGTSLFSPLISMNTGLTVVAGDLGFTKVTASGTAPGAVGAKMELVCGTGAGTAKLIVYAGTSITPVTVVDNIGSGVTGC